MDLTDGGGELRHDGGRGLRGAYDDREVGVGALRERQVDGRPDWLVERAFADVVDDTDDLLHRLRRERGVAHALANRILIREIQPRQRLVDDGDLRFRRVVPGGEVPAGSEPRAERGE